MGNLHKGHIKLIESATNYHANTTLLSIFVNPLQFDNKKDFTNYPNTIEKDIDIAFKSGADAIFIPTNEEIFPKDKNINFIKACKILTSSLCGVKRTGHFDGVCTVVYRLIKLINPVNLFLGEKDWQQVLIIKKMISDKELKVKVKTIPTLRDFDGAPYSSRNTLLSEEDRKHLMLFSQELVNTKNLFVKEKKIEINNLKRTLNQYNISIEYLELVNAYDLQETTERDNISLLAGAIICGSTRLIDHVFLMKKHPVIAIDGPAGSGKSTVTKLIAKKLNYIYLDTGAMYRALSWFLINEKINYKDNNELKRCLEKISITFQSDSSSIQDVFINKYCVTKEIRTQEINKIVSSIASIAIVREFLVKEQRKIGASGGLVAEGRDTATTVFPDAELKIFLNASIEERANRRTIELKNTGTEEINLEDIKAQIKQRDFDDSNREISPLTKDKKAIEIFTDGYTVEEIAEKILEEYNQIIPKEISIENV